jgi:polyvinyl alcohol dehydrogenase (cytochrome)
MKRLALMIATPSQIFRRTGLLALTVVSIAGLATILATAPSSAARSSTSWTLYHGDLAGSGDASSVAAVDTTRPAWTTPALDGQLFGEPLVSSGRVYVATENDTLYALSSSTGSVIWSTHVGTPVPAGDLPCGDITPTVGITGTPAIDENRAEIYAVAEELVDGRPVHVLVGVSTASGKVETTQNVDPSGSDPAALLERTGLTLDAGSVVFAMGGNYGDCASYRGRVVAVSESGGLPRFFTVDAASGDSQGAIWMGGAAPAIDSNGNIWVGVGNGSVRTSSQAYDDSGSALELSSSLSLLQYFAPTNWPQNNAHDLDMSIAPALLSDGEVVLAGKSRIVYLLNGSDLGGIGGQQAALPSGCADDIDGGTAVVTSTVYLPCLAGVIAVEATRSPAALHIEWNSHVGGGPPIAAGGLIWTISLTGTLYGLDATTGRVQQRASIGVPANHFPTPSVGDGYLLAANAHHVVAFKTTSATATTSPTSTESTTPNRSKQHSAIVTHSNTGTESWGATVAIVAGVVLVVGSGLWLYWRRRVRRSP